MVNNELASDPEHGTAVQQAYVLGTRIEGDEAVPLDFALDLDPHHPGAAPLGPSFGIVLNPGAADRQELHSDLPDPGGPGKGSQLRYLCSWHKRRWHGGGEPTWRLQVLAQRRGDSEQEWLTVSKLSGYGNAASEIQTGWHVRQVRLTLPLPVPYVARTVRMSDYTDPMWLSFIGSFGREHTGHPEQYRCVRSATALQLQSLDNAPELELRGLEEDSPCFHVLLVYRPLVDITRADVRNDAGALVGAYFYSLHAASGSRGFKSMDMGAGLGDGSLAGCFAYLCTVQRITSPSASEIGGLHDPAQFGTLQDFVDRLFPDGGESTMRLLPEYIGPIPAADHT
jgi:hypothetical protein